VNPGSSATPKSSSSAVVPPSSSTVVVTDLVLIDDSEDGNEVAKTGGTWYAYTDKEPGGQSSITNVYDPALPGYIVTFAGTVDPTNGTAGFVGLQGIVWNQANYEEAPFVALGLNLMADTSLGADLSGCNAISYRYKGNKHVFKVQDGQVTDYAYHQVKVDSSSIWTEVILPFEKLEQPVWTKDPKVMNYASVKKMAWEVVGYKNFEMNPTHNYLYVDDLKCVNATVGIKQIARAASGLKLAAQGGNLNIMTAKSGLVKVQVFDMTGHSVKSVSENMQAGAHTVSLENLTAGSYIVRIQAGSAVKSARITLK
jgi:endoglucanase